MQSLRKRIDAAHADAMQTARNFVAIGIEFSAGVQLGQHHLRGGNAFFRVDIHGNPAAVIDDGERVIDMDRDADFGAIAGQRFIDGVVDDFVDQMVQSHLTGGADVHGGTQPNRLQAFQDLDTA